MPVLGYGQVSGIAPGLFQDAGDSIVAGIRRTGQEIRKNLQTIQTNKQLNAFGQEAATLDPAAPNFATSLMGLAGKYPLAAGSEAGQTMVGLLASANKNAMGLEMDARNFNQQKALSLLNNRYRKEADVQDFNQQKELKNIEHQNRMNEIGARKRVVTDKFGRIIDPSTGVLIADIPKDEQGNPLFRNPGDEKDWDIEGGRLLNRRTGEIRELGLDPNQRRIAGDSQARLEMSQINSKIASLDREFSVLQNTLARMDQSHPEYAATRQKLLDVNVAKDVARKRMDELEIMAADFVPGPGGGVSRPSAPAVLGGLNPPPLLPADPMNSPAPVPQVGGGSVLPPAGVLPQGGQKIDPRKYFKLQPP